MKKIFVKLKYIKAYFSFIKRKLGINICDIDRGAGYYMTMHTPYGTEEKLKMNSGYVVTIKLIDYKFYSDPFDMIENSRWQLMGIEEKKSINECNFHEFIELYSDYLNLI